MTTGPIILSACSENLRQILQAPAATPVPLVLPMFLESISAGFPSPATDYMECGLDANEYLVKNKAASFYLEVSGCSMVNAGILDGDKVLIDRSIEPTHNCIVVAVLNNKFTLKRLYMQNGVIELRPENPAFQTIRLQEGDELVAWPVVGLIRKL
ncbi:MAG: LexA family protein [Burkholderiaceae bacterium]